MPRRPGLCPACEVAISAGRRAVGLVIDGLADPAHARLYAAHTGMCLPHVVQAALAAEAPTLKLIAERLFESLTGSREDALVELLAGVDRDASRRAAWRQQLPVEQAGGSTLGDLSDRLALDACPVCLSTGWIERRYIQWFVERQQEHDASIVSDPGELCASHLHDVALADPRGRFRCGRAQTSDQAGRAARVARPSVRATVAEPPRPSLWLGRC